LFAFKRIHASGTEAVLSESPDGSWRLQLTLSEVKQKEITITVPTLAAAKEFADDALLKRGHVSSWWRDFHPEKR
jgi:hypothetical protein